MNQAESNAMSLLNCQVQGQNICTAGLQTFEQATTSAYYQQQGIGGTTLWGYWQDQYYPQVIRESYPVYIRERAMDKGKQAFEILKALMDKNLVKIDKVKDFIEAMDTLLKTL